MSDCARLSHSLDSDDEHAMSCTAKAIEFSGLSEQYSQQSPLMH